MLFYSNAASSLLLAASVLLGVSASSQPGLKVINARASLASGSVSEGTFPLPLVYPIEIQQSSTLKLSFAVQNAETTETVVPQHALLQFQDTSSGDVVTLAVDVKADGKARYDITGAKLPKVLTATSGSLDLTLLLGSPGLTPLRLALGQIQLPRSALTLISRKRHDLPPRAGEPAFQPEPELFHTFREDEKLVGGFKSVIGTIAVLFPWVVLLSLYTRISPSLLRRAPAPSTYFFLLTLAGLEGLIVSYWIGLKLYCFLPPFLALAVVSAYSGKVALSAHRKNRK